MTEDDLASLLEAAGLGTIKEEGNSGDIFTSQIPETPDNLIAILEYAGNPPDFTHNLPGIAGSRPRLQINVRNAVPETAKELADSIFRTLSRVRNTPILGTRYVRISPLQTPYLRVRDENDRFTYTFNVEAWKAGL